MNDHTVSTQGLVKVYPGVRALDGLNLNVPRGAVYGFLGRNGAGKTTTIKILGGLVRATSGTARVLGRDSQADGIAIRQRTAFVGERKALYELFTPAELVRFTRGFYPEWSDAKAEKYARLLEIPMHQRVGKLSRGNRTKVCLLLALAQPAELLVMDEPTSGLDPVMTDQLLSILVEDHAGEGRTIFFSSHQLAEVEQICDWVGIIDEGRLLLEARLDDVRAEYRTITAAGRDLPLATAEPVLAAVRSGQFVKYLVSRNADEFAAGLGRNGAAVTSVSEVTLRDVFLQLVRKEEPCISGNAGETHVLASSSF